MWKWILVIAVGFGAWQMLGKGGSAEFRAYGSSDAGIVMYSLRTCGNCIVKARELRENGIAFTEYFMDEDAKRESELVDKMGRAGFAPKAFGTPVLDVGGIMLPDNPSVETILKAREKSGAM